jgi:hypothetical protein
VFTHFRPKLTYIGKISIADFIHKDWYFLCLTSEDHGRLELLSAFSSEIRLNKGLLLLKTVFEKNSENAFYPENSSCNHKN